MLNTITKVASLGGYFIIIYKIFILETMEISFSQEAIQTCVQTINLKGPTQHLQHYWSRADLNLKSARTKRTGTQA